MLALGEGSTCSLSAAGQIRCWGHNHYGALGTDRDGNVTGIDGQVRAIAAGGHQQCALTSTGDVWCWGSNLEGAVGNGQVAESEKPVLKPIRVAGISRVKSLHLGDKISCALTQDSALYCWGRNLHHEIDSSSTKMLTSPTRVSGTGRVDIVAVGNYHICYATNGRVQCTGNLEPLNADISGLRNVTSLSAGYQHSCAVYDGGKVSCWGGDYLGVLGQGNQCAGVTNDGGECVSKMRAPVIVPGIAPDAVEIAGNTYHTCVRHSTGAVTCFGSNQGGHFTDKLPKEPWQKAIVLDGVVADQVFVGGGHVCTMRAGAFTCRGNDGEGAVSGGH
jgi:alpha-tubulin suppressor-like RCC1 family protein